MDDRDCDGGGQNCAASETSWSMTLSLSGMLTLSVPVLPPGATYVNLVSDSGHDYTNATAAVSGPVTGGTSLSPASPNPTRGSTTIQLVLTTAEAVNVGVFDLAGRQVATLADGALGPGVHTLVWDGRDARGGRVPAGVYFVHARGERIDATRRVLRID